MTRTSLLIWVAIFLLPVVVAGEEVSQEPSAQDSKSPLPTPTPEATPQEVVVEAPTQSGPLLPGAVVDAIDVEAFALRFAELDDALTTAPGLDVRDFGGLGQPRFVQLRGGGPEHTVVIADGARVNPILGGGADLSMLALSDFDSVEVVRGPVAMQYGADAVGGVVRLMSSTREGMWGGGAVSLGSFDTLAGRAHFGFGDANSKNRVSARFTQSRGDFEFRDTQRGVTVTRNNNDFRQGGGNYRRDFSTGPWRVNGGAQASALEGGSPGYSEFPTPDARRRALVVHAHAGASYVAPRATVSGQVAHRYEEAQYTNPQSVLGSSDMTTSSTARGLDAQVSGRGMLGEWAYYGVEIANRHEELLDQSYGAPERDLLALQAGSGLVVGAVSAGLQLRTEVVAADGAESLLAIPTIGAAWQGEMGFHMHSTVGRVARNPSFLELFHPDQEVIVGNPSLNAEAGWSGDLGVGMRHGLHDIGVTGFATRLEESILWAPVATNRYQPINAGATRAIGVETSVRTRIAEVVSARVTYTYLDTLRLDSNTALPNRAPHQGGVGVVLHPREDLRIFTDARYQSEATADLFGNLFVPSTTNIASGVTFVGPAGWAWTVEGRNLLDADVRDDRYLPQPGRSVFITLTWNSRQENSG